MNTRTESISIEGMSCGHCVHAVRTVLEDVAGVDVEDVQIGTARISYDADAVSREQITSALEEEGYPTKDFQPVQ